MLIVLNFIDSARLLDGRMSSGNVDSLILGANTIPVPSDWRITKFWSYVCRLIETTVSMIIVSSISITTTARRICPFGPLVTGGCDYIVRATDDNNLVTTTRHSITIQMFMDLLWCVDHRERKQIENEEGGCELVISLSE